MSIAQQLSALAVRGLFEGFCRSIGFEAGAAASEAAVKFLGSRFTDHSARLEQALQRAGGSAWRALELALAGDSWWDRVKVSLARKEDQVFREQVGAFLRTTPLAGLPEHPPEFRAQALRELRAASKAGLLAQGGVDPVALAQMAGPFARFSNSQALLDAEWSLLETVIDSLRRAGHGALAHFLSLRVEGQSALLVVAVRYFFRRELEEDAQLCSALMFAKLEHLAEIQEAGFDGLHSALSKHTARFEELLEGAALVLEQLRAVVTETHGDVKDIKAALERQGQALDTVGAAVFRALAAPTEAPGQPARKEEDIRLEMLNTLLTTPHRDLMPLWPIHQQLCSQDPRFYVRLAAWYSDKGDVRDHKEMFVVTLALSQFEGHRDVGLALLRKMPPYQIARVVDFVHGRKVTRRKRVGTPKKPKTTREVVGEFGLFRAVPRSLRTEVARYLAEREANAEWFDSTVLTARKSLKRLYSVLHIKPGERAQRILFDNDPPADSRLAVLKQIVTMKDPQQQADALRRAKVPLRVALSVVSTLAPVVLRSLIERMTPQEVINNLGMLQRHGALGDPEMKLLVDIKLEEARTSKKVSALKVEKALEAIEPEEGLREKLEAVADWQIKSKGRLRRATAILVDKSGSMELAIELGKKIAAMLSAACEKELYVYAFDSMAYAIESKGQEYADWVRAFQGIHAMGETSVGVALELMRRRKQSVEQLVIVTDEEEYTPPLFIESYLKYRQAMGVNPAICFVKVPDSTTKLEDQCKRAGLNYSVFSFTGDYYALPNLISLLEPPSQLDLLMDIMDYPLPQREPASR